MEDQPVTKKDLVEALAEAKQEILAVTKKDLAETKQEILAVTKKDLAEALAETKQEILERTQEMVRDSQTEILRGFDVYAKISEARLRRLESGLLTLHADDAAMNERIASLESRLLEVEQKLMLRPPAA